MTKQDNGCEEPRCSKNREIFEILGKCWTGLIIRDLLDGPRRFREILNDIGDINDKMLSARLKELEVLGIISRTVYPEVPVRVEYALTGKGRDLERAIEELERWTERWQAVAASKGGK
ncbi:MAG: winged helix-turn-helix transcriptional regulator [Anaerolineae bacterium]